MHNAFINIDHKKMSKSLGNFLTVRDVIKRWDPMVLRFYMLSAHYRNPLNFSAELMDSAKQSLERILTAVQRLRELSGRLSGEELLPGEEKVREAAEEQRRNFNERMDDDLNTADAITAVFELVRIANSSVSEQSSAAICRYMLDTIVTLLSVLGIRTERKEEKLDREVEELIEERQKAREKKDFKRADEIRDRLLSMGISLKDTREGVKWSRS